MLRIIDSQKLQVLYTWELYDAIISFQCVQDLEFLRLTISKQSVLSSYHNTLQLIWIWKGSASLYTL